MEKTRSKSPIVRLAASWLLAVTVMFPFRLKLTLYFILTASVMLLLFAVLSLLGRRLSHLDAPAFLAASLIYTVVLFIAGEVNAAVFMLPVTLYGGFLCLKSLRKSPCTFLYDELPPIADETPDRLPKWLAVMLLSLLTASLFAFIAVFTCLRIATYASPCFDYGIFVNMFHYMRETGLPLTTCERETLLSHFAVHVSPIYYLILPFYALFPSVYTLNIAQAAVVASALIPFYLLARRSGLRRGQTLLLSAAFIFYPAVSGGCFYDIHENCFLLPLILWLMWAYTAKKDLPMYIFAVLILLVKEDAALYVIAFALFMIFSGKKFEKKRVLKGLILLGVSVGYFALVCFLLKNFGKGIMTTRYTLYGRNFGQMFMRLFSAPDIAFGEIFAETKIGFLLSMLIPLVLLPLLSPEPSEFILLIPFIVINLMTDYKYQHDIFFHYVFGSSAYLLILTVRRTAQLKKDLIRTVASALVLIFSFFAFTNTVYKEKGDLPEIYEEFIGENRQITDLLDSIPGDASVQCSTFFLPHIADRDEIYSLEKKYQRHPTDYIVLDLRFGSEDYLVTELDASEDYTCVWYIEYVAALYKKN